MIRPFPVFPVLGSLRHAWHKIYSFHSVSDHRRLVRRQEHGFRRDQYPALLDLHLVPGDLDSRIASFAGDPVESPVVPGAYDGFFVERSLSKRPADVNAAFTRLHHFAGDEHVLPMASETMGL